MYTVQDFLDELSWGDFKHIKLGNSTLGTISAANHPMIISMINYGMTELHKRFDIRRNTLFLQQNAGITDYYLRPDFAVTSTSAEPVKYLIDSAGKPFQDDILKINMLWDEEGNELEIGDSSASYPIFRPRFDILEMTPFDPPQLLKIRYRANHPMIVVAEDFDPKDIEIKLERTFHDALGCYVAARVFTGMDPSGKNSGQDGQQFSPYWHRFRVACENCDPFTMADDSNVTYSKLDAKGFV